MPNTVHVLNGPNLNLLGEREPHIYGAETLADIEARTLDRAARHALDIVFRQSNHEGVLVDWIQEARAEKAAAIVINGAGLTFYSIAILNALQAYDGIIIEIHLSNPQRREAIYHDSLISKIATGVIEGFLGDTYELAIEAVALRLRRG
ncbi:MAG: 3-dehydroquinate dehydratase [Rhodobiaceae bacterium]|nr:3-dehydroquinate dehydratase [Rhodobiaceae bacterium]